MPRRPHRKSPGTPPRKRGGRAANPRLRRPPGTRPARKRPADEERFLLCLYITGTTPRSLAAIDAITRLCDKQLSGRYELRVVDIYQQPTLARDEQIIAAPTLVKNAPSPRRRMVGNLSDTRRVRMSLGLPDATGGNAT